jgi:NAD+ synthase (glutamine-hydrolysing)
LRRPFLGDWLAEKALSNLPSIAAFTKNIAVAVGLPIRVHGNAYNCVAVLENGRLLGITAKQFLANDGVHYEPRWFTPWQAGQQIHLEINGQQVPFGDLTYSLFGVHTGFEICEDAWRKNRPACRMQQENIELIMNPSASHFALGNLPCASAWLLIVHANSAAIMCMPIYSAMRLAECFTMEKS